MLEAKLFKNNPKCGKYKLDVLKLKFSQKYFETLEFGKKWTKKCHNDRWRVGVAFYLKNYGPILQEQLA